MKKWIFFYQAGNNSRVTQFTSLITTLRYWYYTRHHHTDKTPLMWFRIAAVLHASQRHVFALFTVQTGLHHQLHCPTNTYKQHTHPPYTIRWGVLLPSPQLSATVVSRSRLSVRCLAFVLRCQIASRATHPLGPFTPTVTWVERSKQYIQFCVSTINLP